MKTSITITLLTLSMFACYAQQRLPINMSQASDKFPYQPLFILRMPGQEIHFKNRFPYDILNADLIEAIYIYQKNNIVTVYGTDAKYGCVIIKLRKTIHIITKDTSEINVNYLAINNTSLNRQYLPVYIDSIYVKYPEDVYLKKKDIKSLIESTEDKSGIKFINILTYKKIDTIKYLKPVMPTKNPKQGSTIIWLRGYIDSLLGN
jgi:hypothetical protein